MKQPLATTGYCGQPVDIDTSSQAKSSVYLNKTLTVSRKANIMTFYPEVILSAIF